MRAERRRAANTRRRGDVHAPFRPSDRLKGSTGAIGTRMGHKRKSRPARRPKWDHVTRERDTRGGKVSRGRRDLLALVLNSLYHLHRVEPRFGAWLTPNRGRRGTAAKGAPSTVRPRGH